MTAMRGLVLPLARDCWSLVCSRVRMRDVGQCFPLYSQRDSRSNKQCVKTKRSHKSSHNSDLLALISMSSNPIFILSAEVTRRLQYPSKQPIYHWTLTNTNISRPEYWSQPFAKWGSVADWDLNFIDEVPGASHQQAHTTLAMDIQILISHLPEKSPAWHKANAFKAELKCYAPQRHVDYSSFRPSTRVGKKVLRSRLQLSSYRTMHVSLCWERASHTLRLGSMNYDLDFRIPSSCARLRTLILYDLLYDLMHTYVFFPYLWQRQKNKKDPVINAIWKRNHTTLVDLAIDNRVGNRKIDNVAVQATATAATTRFAPTHKRRRGESETGHEYDSDTSSDGDVAGDPVNESEEIEDKCVTEVSTSGKQLAANVEDEEPSYTAVIDAINIIRRDDAAAHTNPLWWGIVDLRPEKISPCPDLPRAKELLQPDEFKRLEQFAVNIVSAESALNPSVNAILEAISTSDILSLHVLGKEYRTRGIVGISELLKTTASNVTSIGEVSESICGSICDSVARSDFSNAKTLCAHLSRLLEERDDVVDETNQIWNSLKDVNPADDDTGYIGECFSAADYTRDRWVCDYGGNVQSERTVDLYLIGAIF
ncbi:hypothetical protein G9A89_003144 [Geosiphon pyriformis]|nr:hypothetical protein G9A89_003144 [Geosiphon pyriformis]